MCQRESSPKPKSALSSQSCVPPRYSRVPTRLNLTHHHHSRTLATLSLPDQSDQCELCTLSYQQNLNYNGDAPLIVVILNGSPLLPSPSTPGVPGLLLVMLNPNPPAKPSPPLKLLLLLPILLLAPLARLLALLLRLADLALCAMPRGAGSGCICGSGSMVKLELCFRDCFGEVRIDPSVDCFGEVRMVPSVDGMEEDDALSEAWRVLDRRWLRSVRMAPDAERIILERDPVRVRDFEVGGEEVDAAVSAVSASSRTVSVWERILRLSESDECDEPCETESLSQSKLLSFSNIPICELEAAGAEACFATVAPPENTGANLLAASVARAG